MNVRLLCLICTALGSTSALAASPVQDTARIDGSASAYQGNFSINQAAGDTLQQANARSIAIGSSASAHTAIEQSSDLAANPARDASAAITGNAFSGGNGLLGVNQAAGASTQQANSVRIGISALPQRIDDSILSQQTVALANSSDATDHAPGSRQVTLGDQAFTGSRGVVQLNQSAGVGNRMANTLSVRVAD
ncbi:hypothetical protein [Pseudomonas cremoricolorata]|uniref:Autotransporter adhesin n=1 Tax=Pseudomonas cremoricolorata TaxID=157783 RepID=A0A089WWK1_9PSED|nr:hypothetical protein [Pseudomonas cremoricolorata]AIR90992.1 autotransporter adhesin [Pseudomonas cremoricolorata]